MHAVFAEQQRKKASSSRKRKREIEGAGDLAKLVSPVAPGVLPAIRYTGPGAAMTESGGGTSSSTTAKSAGKVNIIGATTMDGGVMARHSGLVRISSPFSSASGPSNNPPSTPTVWSKLLHVCSFAVLIVRVHLWRTRHHMYRMSRFFH